MIPWVCLDRAATPDGGELRLMQRGHELVIMLGRDELMSSHRPTSEQALATLSCARLLGRVAPRVLIGGLGMGFTLRAAQAALGPDARIVGAELVPAVVAWARGPMAELFGASLDDPRLSVVEGDVGLLIRSGRAAFDAILLDVDNGPEGFTQGANDGLYGPGGLRAAREALRPGGVLGIWSAGADPRFAERLRSAGFGVEEVSARAYGTRGGPKHVIWIATLGHRRASARTGGRG